MKALYRKLYEHFENFWHSGYDVILQHMPIICEECRDIVLYPKVLSTAKARYVTVRCGCSNFFGYQVYREWEITCEHFDRISTFPFIVPRKKLSFAIVKDKLVCLFCHEISGLPLVLHHNDYPEYPEDRGTS